jgi:prephenate dehydratase
VTCAGGPCALPSWPTNTSDAPLTHTARTLGFLGPAGTFTEEALWRTIGGAPPLDDATAAERAEESGGRLVIAYASIADTIRAVADGEVECAIVAVENAIEGTVTASVDILAHEVVNLQVVREVRLPITHRLIAGPGVTLDQVTRIISIPVATAQCRLWLNDHLPGIEVEAANSTAAAVERAVKSDQPWAAIGSALAAKEHGGIILQSSIEDHDDNETRFVFLSQQRERQDLDEPYKTSVVCHISKDQPGALLLILQEFAYRYINLTKIESRPSKRGLGDYIFLVDMEGRIDDPSISDALSCLNCKLPRLTVLGSYPVGRPAPPLDAF